MKTALVQTELADSKEVNLAKALRAIKASDDCDLVVLPEMTMGRRTSDTELWHMAEDVNSGGFASALKDAARESKVHVCACLWEANGSDRVFNTAVVYAPDGTLKAKYRKLHLFDALSVRESDFMLRGDDLPPVFECAGVMCGLSICYDLRFPEVYRSLVRRGAEFLVLPAAWYSGDMKVNHLHTLLAARALENTSFAVCANLCGSDFCGHSAAYSPYGREMETLGDKEGILKVQIDLNEVARVRTVLPCLANFRDDIL